MSDNILISNHFNIFYLTGFKGLAENEREAWVIRTKNSDGPDSLHLITDGRYFEKIKNRTDIIPHLLSFEEPLRKVLNDLIVNEKITSLEFEADDLTVDEHARLVDALTVKLKPSTGAVAKLRTKKNPKELEIIRKACAVTDECFESIAPHIQIGQTEQEIAKNIEMWLRDRDHDLAFYPIVAIDASGSVPHYDTRSDGTTIVKEHSDILIDFGAKVENYCADMTRMISIGQPSEEFTKAYDSVRKAQEQAIIALENESKYSVIDETARTIITDAGYPTYEHSTGHGLGLEIHEGPRISSHSTDIKESGHVITIEPGLYLEGKFGIRIEDTVAINEDGKPEVLTKTSKELKRIS